MAGSTRRTAALRELIAKGDRASTLDAVDLAVTMSVGSVREQLDYDFLDGHADEASRFFAGWLARLQGFERMAAADWAGVQYVLSIVHLDHAYGVGARIVMEALVEATRATAESLEAFRAFTQGPDAEVAELVAGRLDGLAAVLRTVHDDIRSELTLLPQRSSEAPGDQSLPSGQMGHGPDGSD